MSVLRSMMALNLKRNNMMGYAVPTKKVMKTLIGKQFIPIETSMFGAEYTGDGEYPVVGPDPYTNRKWFASVTVKNGLIAKVK